jgi:hypothetical protein
MVWYGGGERRESSIDIEGKFCQQDDVSAEHESRRQSGLESR